MIGTGGCRGGSEGAGHPGPRQTERGIAATAAPSPRSHDDGVNSRSERPGGGAFFHGSVQFMASSPGEEFAAELGAAVVAKASALLVSVRKTSLHPPEILSVQRAWSTMDHTSWKGQMRATPTLAFVKAL